MELCFSSRHPKLYLISTTTSTSTVSTTSVCWVMSATANGIITCKKKKRSISFLDDSPSKQRAAEIAPNPSIKSSAEEVFTKVYGVGAEVSPSTEEMDEEREARYLQYWLTRTMITTFTTFTATSSIGSIFCTPVGYKNIPCPGNG